MCFFLLSLLLFSLSGSKTWPPERTMEKTVFYGESINWKTAQNQCRKYHTDLITIRNEKDNQHFLRIHGWLGLFRENTTGQWKWSHGDETANYYAWDKNEPKNNQNCVFKINSQNKWRTDSCDSLSSVNCYEEKLVLVRENKTWEEALAHCRSLRGVDTNDPPNRNSLYDLASLITNDDHITARERAQKATTDEVWTGLRFLAGHWWWVDREPMLYKDIESCPAERSCGAIEKTGTANFTTRDCRERRNFLCYKRV